jgi:hypothetical protein
VTAGARPLPGPAGGPMTAAEVEALFTRGDGTFLFARWGRAMAPVVFGLDPGALPVVKGALQAVAALAGQRLAETDPELGVNLMLFFCRDWAELAGVPGLDRLVPDLGPLIARLEAGAANQYRIFRFDAEGAIRACFAFVRMDAHLAAVPGEVLALNQAVQVILLWSDRAFGPGQAALTVTEGGARLRAEVAGVIRAAYDPVLPAMSRDRATAMRIAARAGRGAML